MPFLTNRMEIKDVENLAKLARIDLGNEEKERILTDIEGILEYVKQIEEVKVSEVETKHVLHNVWREDVLISREFSRDSITEQFPDSQNGFLKVKKIL